MSILIKRYANRKLYNTETSRYITLKGISELIEAGDEVRVIDNETGEDITSVALSQILVDSERSSRWVSRTVLSDLIQRGGDALYGALRRGVDDASEGIDEVRVLQADVTVTRDETIFAAELLFEEIAMTGRGGTSFVPALTQLAEEAERFGYEGAWAADAARW